MTLEEQLKNLVDEAPRYGVPDLVMEQIVIPVITLLAQQLAHLQYYILQTSQGDWLLNILSSRQDPNIQKTVIYAFANISDAMAFQGPTETMALAQPMAIADILLQLIALDQVDSIIFLETPGNLTQGSEIPRAQLQSLIEEYLNRLTESDKPPHIA